MTPHETALLLTLASAYDQRTVGDADVMAWAELLAGTSFTDAQVVVKAHYATKRERLVPVDVLEGVRAIRTDRINRYEAWVQPGSELTQAEYRDWLVSTRKRLADGWIPPEPPAIDQRRRDQLDTAINPTFPATPKADDDAA